MNRIKDTFATKMVFKVDFLTTQVFKLNMTFESLVLHCTALPISISDRLYLKVLWVVARVFLGWL